ncbi:MAG: hypothetical protein H7210_13765, partial [Pyrinomonadaceae bacterium]|nr:hypothetical protein [Phycisphaerales bacterium]
PPPAANDHCADAADIAGEGTFNFDTRGALTDGTASCDLTIGRDVWFDWTAPCAGDFNVSLCAGSTGDTIFNAYSSLACPPDQANEIACDDDGCGGVGGPSIANINGIAAGAHVLIRISHFGGSTGEQGAFVISRVGGSCGPTCPCDWNSSGSLNSQDFFDFLVSFFGGNADFNNSGTTNSQDFFDFLVCFFTPPTGC